MDHKVTISRPCLCALACRDSGNSVRTGILCDRSGIEEVDHTDTKVKGMGGEADLCEVVALSNSARI